MAPHYIFVSVLALAAGTAAGAAPIKDQTVMVSDDDAEMARAISTARQSLDEFLRLAAHPPQGASGFKLKVQLRDGDQSEHLWITPFRQERDGFVGIVANDPDFIKNVSNGQRISFDRSDVSDWGYVQDGKQKGSFTVCVVLKHLPKAEAQRYRQDHGFEC
jgi:uncharacterized protein YegJ (DUF2314 family)